MMDLLDLLGSLAFSGLAVLLSFECFCRTTRGSGKTTRPVLLVLYTAGAFIAMATALLPLSGVSIHPLHILLLGWIASINVAFSPGWVNGPPPAARRKQENADV